MKILLIAPMSLPIPCEKGAVEEIIWQVARRLKKCAEVSIFNPITPSNLRRFLMGGTLALRSSSDDIVVHSHNLYASLGLASMSRLKDQIITLHYPPWIAKSEGKKKTLLYLLKLLHSKGAIIASPSIAITRYLAERRFKRIAYIPNGADVQIFNSSKRDYELREKLLNGKEALVVNVGRVHPDKNQLALLKAARYVLKERKDVKIIFVGPTTGGFSKSVGESWYYQALLQYVEKHSLRPYVEFLGEVPRKEEVAKILASADIYAHPSVVEAAAPLAILEAMASGLPIVAFDLPLYEGYLFSSINAKLIPLNGVERFGRTLVQLIEDRGLRKRLSQNALKSAKNIFSWDVIVPKYYFPMYFDLITH